MGGMEDPETNLMPLYNGGEEEDGLPLCDVKAESGQRRWWNKLFDLEETKEQFTLAVPMILTNVGYYLITLISVMFCGQLGETELAASNLANSWASVTGFAVMVGLSGGMETLCGQGYGAKLYRMLGIHLQASCIISFFFTILVSILWWYTDFLLTLLHQDPQISQAASLYLKYLIPGLFTYGFLQNILRFLQMQSVVFPLVVGSLIPLLFHVGITYSLVHWTSLGFKGAALASSVSLWISVFILVAYVLCASRFEETWGGFSMESIFFVFVNLKLAVPSAAMVCLEDCAFELLVLLAGLMPNTTKSTSLIAMCVNTQAICYMFAYSLGAAASTRVSNMLGAGDPDRAKHAMSVALKLTVFLAVAVVLALAFGQNIWASSFSKSTAVTQAFSSMAPLLAVSISFDFIQGVLTGVARGCGWQHVVLCINLAAFYLIGMPMAVFLCFKFKLYARGLWIGLICGLSSQTFCLLLLTKVTKWSRINLSTQICVGE